MSAAPGAGPVRLRLALLHVEGYGRLRDFAFEPAREPGALVVAPNEAGKSTLASALFRGLFGFADKGREEVRRPWEGGPFAVSLEWELGERTTCTIRRDFDSQAVAVEWRVDGAIDHRWEGEPNPRGRSSDRAAFDDELRRLLGFVSPEIFRQTAFVGPGDPDVRPLAHELLRLLSGGERADFKSALARFEAGYYELTRMDIGDPARVAKHKARRIEELADRRADLVARREEALHVRDGRRAVEEKLTEARARMVGIDRDLADRAAARGAIERMARLREEIVAAERRRDEVERGIARFVEWERRVREKTAALEPVVGYLRVSRDFADRVRRLRDLRADHARIRAECEAIRAGLDRSPRPGSAAAAAGAGVVVAVAAIAYALLVPGASGAVGWGLAAAAGALAAWAAGRAWSRRERRRELATRWVALRAEVERIDRERAAVAEPLPFAAEAVELETELERYERAHQLKAELDGMQEARRALGERDGLERERRRIKEETLDVLRLEQRRLLETHPYLESGPEYERRFLQEERGLLEERERVEALELDLRRRLADMPAAEEDPHRLAAAIERVDEEIARCRLERDAHRFAWRTLSDCKDEFVEVMTRRLAHRIGRVFEEMTGGRYSAVEIDPSSLDLSVHGVEKRSVPAESLSRGARDQLYFALRVAVLEELASDRSLPLVLDDPFLHFDRERLACAEEILERLGRRHQVLLFTHDPRLVAWAFPRRRLPAPGGSTVVAQSRD